jgi:hypothetical protein
MLPPPHGEAEGVGGGEAGPAAGFQAQKCKMPFGE